jgi:hypothetical protein
MLHFSEMQQIRSLGFLMSDGEGKKGRKVEALEDAATFL